MTESVDVAIVGGGIAGASLAFYLARAGVRNVLVLERTAVAAGASGRASGLLTFLAGSHPTQAAVLRASADLYRDWGDLVGGAPALTPTGAVLLLAEDRRRFAEREVDRMRAAWHDLVLLERRDAETLLPGWDLTGVDLALYSAGSGAIDPPYVTTALMNRARALGARVYQGVTARAIRVQSGRVAGVETERGRIAADTVVIAAGVWSAGVARLAGVALPIWPVRHEVVHLAPPPGSRPAALLCCSDPANGVYLRPEAGGLITAGPMQDDERLPESLDAMDAFDAGIGRDRGAEVRARLARRIPSLAGAAIVGGHAGVFALSPDCYPLLGSISGIEGLHVICDTAGNGMTSSPGLARALAETIVHGHAFVDIALYRPSRFAGGATISPPYHHTGAEVRETWIGSAAV